LEIFCSWPVIPGQFTQSEPASGIKRRQKNKCSGVMACFFEAAIPLFVQAVGKMVPAKIHFFVKNRPLFLQFLGEMAVQGRLQ
jgi:hypothetical protein